MPALGPRVGGAHVDVNLKFDDSSLDALGARIHKQLASIGAHNKSVYQSIGREGVTAWRSLLGTIIAGGPLIGSAVSAAAGGLTMLAGSVYSVGQSTAALLPIFTSLGVAGFTLSVGMRNFGAAVSEIDPKRLALLLKDMPPSMQAAVLSTRKLSKEMRAAVWPKLFAGLSDGIEKLRGTGVLTKGLGAMADQLNGLAKSVLDYAATKEGVSTLNKFFANNAKVFGALSQAVVPFLDGFLRLVNALTPAAIRLAGRITDIATRFQEWTKGEGFGKRINESMKKAEKTAGLLWNVITNLGAAIANIFGITNPATNTFLEMLVAMTQRFEDFTNSAGGKNSIAEWAMNSVGVMKQFGKTIEAVFKVIAELADPRVITSFLKTVEGAFNHLGDLPLDKMIDAFVKIAQALQPISSWLLAAIVAGVAFNIFLGSLMGQLGGLFSALGRITGFGDVFKGVGGSAGKHAAEIGKFTGVLRGIGTILGRTLKFAGLAGLAVYIVMLVSKSKMLQDKLVKVFDAFKGLWAPLKTAFLEIKKALTPVTDGLSPVFDWFDKIATLGIGLILDSIIYAFESLGNVIKGAGKIIAGLINVLVGLFTLDFSKVWEGLKQMASGVVPLLKGLFGLFVTFFAPARLAKLGLFAFRGLGSGIVKAMPAILTFVGKFLIRFIKFFATLPLKLLRFGGEALIRLGKGIGRAIPWVLGIVGRFIVRFLKFYVSLPGKLLRFGGQAIQFLGKAIARAVPWVIGIVGRLLGAILRGLAKLPELLFKLGVWALRKLGGALRSGASKLASAAGTIFRAIWDEVKALPKTLLKLGGAMIGGIIKGIKDKLKGLKDAAGKIGSAIKDALPGSPVKEGPLTAWNSGGGASGGGRNVIDAIAGGLRNTDPIKKAMRDVASTVSTSITPRVGATVSASSATRARPTGSEPTGAGNVYIGNMMPHNYTEFRRQLTSEERLAALGGRRAVRA